MDANEAALAAPSGGSRRRRGGVALATAALVVFALLVASTVGGLVGTHHADDQLAATKRRISYDRVLVVRAQQHLARAQATERATAAQVAAVTAKLQRAGNQLTGTERAVFEGRLNLNALQSCLGGVEEAVNALSVGDDASALRSLSAVGAQCKESASANG